MNRESVLKLLLWAIALYHVVLGGGAFLSVDLAQQIARSIFGIEVTLDPAMSFVTKVLGVYAITFGLVAYVIALKAGGIYELVATASAFGSSGIFVVGLFGLFSRYGGALAAYAALLVGMVVWLAGELVLELTAPYVLSLVAAFGAYVVAAWLDMRRAGS